MKHGDVNATLPDRDKVDTLTLPEALACSRKRYRSWGVRRRPQGPQGAGTQDAGETGRRAARSEGRRRGAPQTEDRQARGSAEVSEVRARARRRRNKGEARGQVAAQDREVGEADASRVAAREEGLQATPAVTRAAGPARPDPQTSRLRTPSALLR